MGVNAKYIDSMLKCIKFLMVFIYRQLTFMFKNMFCELTYIMFITVNDFFSEKTYSRNWYGKHGQGHCKYRNDILICFHWIFSSWSYPMQVFQLDRYTNHIHVSETKYPECRVPRQRWKGLKAIIKVGYKYIISKIKLYTLISCETRQILFVWDVFESQKKTPPQSALKWVELILLFVCFFLRHFCR